MADIADVRRLPAALAVALLALTAGLAVAPAAIGAPGSSRSPGAPGATRVQSPDVQVAAGWEGRARPGRLLPVRVTLSGAAASSDEVDVRVQSGNGGVTTTRTAPTRKGATARATVVVSAPRDVGAFTVSVTAHHGGRSTTTDASVEPAGDEELVGVLPVLARQAPPPATEPLSVPIGNARFTTVDLPTLAVVGSIEPLGTLAANGLELASLTAPQRTNLLAWLAKGGRLLVDEVDGPISGLPTAWQPSRARPRVPAGLGEVRLTAKRLALGGWSGAIEPTPTVSPADPDIVTSAFPGGPVSQAIARDSGLRIPSLGSVLAFLLGYVLLAGPITFLVLHRLHRAELAWVVVPLLAVGFTVGGWYIGGQARENTRTAYSAATVETPGVDLDLGFVGVLSRQGGDRSIGFPTGWWGGNVANELYGPAEAPVTTTVGDAGVRAQVSLVGGEFAVLSGRGPAPVTHRLELTSAATADGSVRGTVRNTSNQLLRQVAVFVGVRSVLVGDLAPGATRSYTVPAGPAARPATGGSATGGTTTTTATTTGPTGTGTTGTGPGVDGSGAPVGTYSSPESRVWPTATTQTFDQRTGPVDLALWGEVTRQLGPDFRAPGSAVAAGWADRLPPPGTVSRISGAQGRTAVVARTPVDPGTTLPGIAVRRDLLRGPSSTPINDANGPTAGAVFRFVLPSADAARQPGSLELSVPATLSRVDVWDGTRWVTMSGSDGTGQTSTPGAGAPAFDGPPTTVALPPKSVQAGVVYVRIAVRLNGPSNSTAELLLQGR